MDVIIFTGHSHLYMSVTMWDVENSKGEFPTFKVGRGGQEVIQVWARVLRVTHMEGSVIPIFTRRLGKVCC